jgi:hypothetical protein
MGHIDRLSPLLRVARAAEGINSWSRSVDLYMAASADASGRACVFPWFRLARDTAPDRVGA